MACGGAVGGEADIEVIVAEGARERERERERENNTYGVKSWPLIQPRRILTSGSKWSL